MRLGQLAGRSCRGWLQSWLCGQPRPHWRLSYTESVLENVKFIGAVNLRSIVRILNKAGIFVHSFVLKSDLYFSPSKRDRQIMLAMPLQDTSFDQYDEGFRAPVWVHDFSSAMEAIQLGPGEPALHTLSADHELIKWHTENQAERKWPTRFPP